MDTSIDSLPVKFSRSEVDRVGVFSSVLCAIHCGLAPVLLLFLPTFGKIWAHPASHAIAAILIVPLAVFSIHRGYKRHRLRWIPVVAILGICFVIFGAVLPAMNSEEHGLSQSVSGVAVDQCCPSVAVAPSGDFSLHIPPAAIVTTLGGLLLITAHLGNLYACRKCCDLPSCS